MIPASGHSQRSDPVMPRPRPAAGGLRDALGELFPSVPEAPARARGAHVLSAVVQVAAVGIASVAMLLRIPGRPAWRTIFGDDYFQFLVGAIQHPWYWRAYGGYVQVLPRFIAQVVSYLPLTDASLAFALAGVVVAACCALFIFHASAGHIESVKLRALLAVALVLLPVAPMELIGSGVETAWYLLPALFWAMLWRPRTRPAMAVAAAVGLLTMASNILAVLLVPLLVARLYVLRRPREHAVSAGWLAGLPGAGDFRYFGCAARPLPALPEACDAPRVARLLRPRRAGALARLAHVVVATVVRRSKRGRRDRGRRTRRQLRPDPRHPAGGTAIRGDRRCSRLHLHGDKRRHQPRTGPKSDASHAGARHSVHDHG